jgi:hypothetical protein
VRPPNRMLVRNPLTDKLESWGHLFSASKAYTVHHKDGGRNGILTAADKMQLYGNFGNPIGKSRDGKELTCLCLIVERIPRPRRNRNGRKHKSGWMVRVHGYPVGKHDIAIDLRGTEVVMPDIPRPDNLS